MGDAVLGHHSADQKFGRAEACKGRLQSGLVKAIGKRLYYYRRLRSRLSEGVVQLDATRSGIEKGSETAA